MIPRHPHRRVGSRPRRHGGPTTATTAATPFAVVESTLPRNVPWVKEELSYGQLPSNFDPQLSSGRYGDAQVYNQGFFERAADAQYTSATPELPGYYEHQSPEAALAAFNSHGKCFMCGQRSHLLTLCRGDVAICRP